MRVLFYFSFFTRAYFIGENVLVPQYFLFFYTCAYFFGENPVLQ